MGAAGITIDDLVVAREEKPVLRGVSVAVRPAEITALVGRNGAGKSTLVMTIAGALKPRAGSIALDGRSLLGLAPDAVRRRGIAAVLEGHRILDGLTVADNLRAAGSMLAGRDLDQQVAKALAIFPELGERLPVRGRSLSGGQKQILSVAQALVSRPRFLLIDELSLGLAPTVVNRLANALKAIVEAGVGILLIEQFTTLALALASRAYVLERGQIVFAGTSAELGQRPDVLHSAYLAGKATV